MERDGQRSWWTTRFRFEPGSPQMRRWFRTLGCYPLTGAVESEADTMDAVIAETLALWNPNAPPA